MSGHKWDRCPAIRPDELSESLRGNQIMAVSKEQRAGNRVENRPQKDSHKEGFLWWFKLIKLIQLLVFGHIWCDLWHRSEDAVVSLRSVIVSLDWRLSNGSLCCLIIFSYASSMALGMATPDWNSQQRLDGFPWNSVQRRQQLTVHFHQFKSAQMKLEMIVIINRKIMENVHQRLLKPQFIHQDNKKRTDSTETASSSNMNMEALKTAVPLMATRGSKSE